VVESSRQAPHLVQAAEVDCRTIGIVKSLKAAGRLLDDRFAPWSRAGRIIQVVTKAAMFADIAFH